MDGRRKEADGRWWEGVDERRWEGVDVGLAWTGDEAEEEGVHGRWVHLGGWLREGGRGEVELH